MGEPTLPAPDGRDTVPWWASWKAALLLLLVVGVALYAEFLSGQRLFISTDLASDQTFACYPHQAFVGRRICSGDLSFWTFTSGLGKNVYRYMTNWNPIDLGYYLTGPRWMAYTVTAFLILKHLAAGLLFYALLRMLRMHPVAALAGCLGLAYSGYMVVQGHWYHYPNYLIFAIALLVAFEAWFQKGRWVWLPLVVGFLQMKYVLTLYQAAVLLTVYASARFLQAGPFRSGAFVRFILKTWGLYWIGLLLNAWRWLPTLLWHMETDRGGRALDMAGGAQSLVDVFRPGSTLEISTVLHRLLSTDLLGTLNDYSGWANPLEGPNVYFGIVLLLLLPQAFAGSNGRERRGWMLLAVASGLYLVFPYARVALNGFARETFKASVYLAVLPLALLGSRGVDAWVRGDGFSLRVLRWTVLAVTAFVCGSLAVNLIAGATPTSGLGTWGRLDFRALAYVMVALLSYSALLMRPPKTPRSSMALAGLLVCVAALECASFSRMTVHSHRRFHPPEMLDTRALYGDDTASVVARLEANDRSFWRLVKHPAVLAGLLNDCMVYGYRGTTGYDSFHQGSTVRFYKTFGLPVTFDDRRLEVLFASAVAESILAVKYVVLPPGVTAMPGILEPVTTLEDDVVYRNRLALPVACAYREALSVRDLLAVGIRYRIPLLVQGVVLPDAETIAALGLQRMDVQAFLRSPVNMQAKLLERAAQGLRVERHSEDEIVGVIDMPPDSLLVSSIPYSRGWKACVDDRPAPTVLANVGFVAVPVPPGTHRVRFAFTPPGLYTGLQLTALGLVLLVALWRGMIPSLTAKLPVKTAMTQ